MKTTSEQLFEEFCTRMSLCCKRILEGDTKTPDYELVITNQQIVIEVKELLRNKEEQESDRLLSHRGYGNVLSNTPGDRVRKKIHDCSPQIKARTQGFHPSILVLFDGGRVAGHLDPYHIRTAMYGLEQVHMAVASNPAIRPCATGMSFGPKRKMTEEHNTSISAIGVLFTPGPNNIGLHVYHNKYAAVALDSSLFRRYPIRQYELQTEEPGKTAQWKEIDLARGR